MKKSEKKENVGKRKLWLSLAVAIVILLIVGFIGKLAADGSADRYAKSFNNWKTTTRTKLLASVPLSVNKKAFPGVITKQSQLDDQKKACAAVQTAWDAMKHPQNLPPRPGFSLFGFLSGRYQAAVKLDKTRDNAVSDFIQTATDLYRQLARDCNYSYDSGAAMYKRYDKAKKQFEGILIPYGSTEDGDNCDVKDGCYPNTPSKLKLYIKYYNAYYTAQNKDDIKYYEGCADHGVSYQKACPAYVKVYQADIAADEAWLKVIGASKLSTRESADGKKIIAAENKRDKAYKTAYDQYLKDLKAALPEIKDKIDGDHTSPDQLSVLLAVAPFKLLAQKADAVKHL